MKIKTVEEFPLVCMGFTDPKYTALCPVHTVEVTWVPGNKEVPGENPQQ